MFERILYQNIDLQGMIYLTGLVNELVFQWQTTFSKRYRLMQIITMLQADKSVLIFVLLTLIAKFLSHCYLTIPCYH